MRALLDVNVLIALLDPDHVHHRTASEWLAQNIHFGWASCPITQNGCIRILAQPGYPSPVPVCDAAHHLMEATRDATHAFWQDSVSLLESELIDWALVQGHRQITDAYLLALAVRNDGRFVTFDTGLSHTVIAAAQAKHLLLIGRS